MSLKASGCTRNFPLLHSFGMIQIVSNLGIKRHVKGETTNLLMQIMLINKKTETEVKRSIAR